MAQEKADIGAGGATRILVLDANIMLRAVLGTRVRSLIERYCEDVALFVPSCCVAEVHEYLPSLCAKRNWDTLATVNLLETLLALVKVVESGFYADFEEQAKRRIGSRDLDDWPVVALALSLGAGIWTEDADFFGSGLATWTTETVEIYLNTDQRQIHEPTPPPYGRAAAAEQPLGADGRVGTKGRPTELVGVNLMRLLPEIEQARRANRLPNLLVRHSQSL
jgi:predicted nucleic acid-binding protein